MRALVLGGPRSPHRRCGEHRNPARAPREVPGGRRGVRHVIAARRCVGNVNRELGESYWNFTGDAECVLQRRLAAATRPVRRLSAISALERRRSRFRTAAKAESHARNGRHERSSAPTGGGHFRAEAGGVDNRARHPPPRGIRSRIREHTSTSLEFHRRIASSHDPTRPDHVAIRCRERSGLSRIGGTTARGVRWPFSAPAQPTVVPAATSAVRRVDFPATPRPGDHSSGYSDVWPSGTARHAGRSPMADAVGARSRSAGSSAIGVVHARSEREPLRRIRRLLPPLVVRWCHRLRREGEVRSDQDNGRGNPLAHERRAMRGRRERRVVERSLLQ